MNGGRLATHHCLATAFLAGCLLSAATIIEAAELPRGLIVQIGGVAPEAGKGRVVHYLEEAPAKLPYAENTVRYLVSEELVVEKEVLRVLRPLGTARIKTESGWRELAKPWPDDIDEWTHWLHGPGSNPVAADRRVGIPRRLLWRRYGPASQAGDHSISPFVRHGLGRYPLFQLRPAQQAISAARPAANQAGRRPCESVSKGGGQGQSSMLPSASPPVEQSPGHTAHYHVSSLPSRRGMPPDGLHRIARRPDSDMLEDGDCPAQR